MHKTDNIGDNYVKTKVSTSLVKKQDLQFNKGMVTTTTVKRLKSEIKFHNLRRVHTIGINGIDFLKNLCQ